MNCKEDKIKYSLYGIRMDDDSPYVTCTSESDIETSFASSTDTCESDIDNDIIDAPWIEKCSEDDILELECTVHELIGEYLHFEISQMANPQFMEMITNDIVNLLFEDFLDYKFTTEDDFEDFEQHISQICADFFETNYNVIPRSYKTPPPCSPKSKEEIQQLETQLTKLKNMPQSKQKSREWYESRHAIITASNLWKVFASELQVNSLIYEKCKPLDYNSPDITQSVNTLSATHWGNKYEEVTVMLYEKLFSTKVEDFGCIIHSKYPYIGASPDGINCDKTSPLYGRMLEIKNIVNREITGIPKHEYWIQTQIQMETCELDECDFMETRFKEYSTPEEFYYGEFLHEHRGIILYFVEKYVMGNPTPSNSPHYVYMPLSHSLEKEDVTAWIQSKRDELKSSHILYETQYWYLDEYSCVLIKRNKDWFNSIIHKIENVWNLIQKEKVEGYEHRMPKKKIVQKLEVTHDENTTNQVIRNLPEMHKSVCLIKLNDDGSIYE